MKFPVQWYYENGLLVHKAVRSAHEVYVEAEFLKPKTKRLYNLECDPGLLPKPVEIPDGPFVKSDRPLCVFVGRFDPRKRPEEFFNLAKKMPDINFIAVGKAHNRAYQEYLESKFFNMQNLEVTGFVDPFKEDKLHQILSKAWVLVHPAAREGLPTAFQEASAREVAILAYVDPTNYVSRFGRVAQRDKGIDGLEEQLRELIASNEWREKGKEGRAYNIEHHSVPKSVAEHLKQYRVHLDKNH